MGTPASVAVAMRSFRSRGERISEFILAEMRVMVIMSPATV